MATRGPVRGRAQRGNEPVYDINSGLPYRTSISVDPLAAVKLVQAARASQMSLSGVINGLLMRMELDEDGRPAWAGELDEDDGRLPLTGS